MPTNILLGTLSKIEMKKIAWLVLILLLTFFVLVYISVSGNKEFETALIVDLEDVKTMDFRDHDSVRVVASSLYKGNYLKETMQGRNYREAWSTPV